MTIPKPRRKERNYTIIDPDTLILAGSEDAGEESIEGKILAEFNQSPKEDDWSVLVERFVKYGQPFEQMFECSADDFKGIPARLREECGPGMYVVSVRHNSILRHRFRYAIGAMKGPAAIARQQMTPATDLASFATIFDNALKEQRALIEKLFANQQPQKQSSITELVTALGALDGLRGKQSDSLGGEKIVELVRMGMEIAEGRGGADGGPMSWGEIVLKLANSDLAKGVAEAAQRLTAQPAVAAPRQISPPAAATQPSGIVAGPQQNQPPAQQPQATEQQIFDFMRVQVAYLVGRAQFHRDTQKRNADPKLYADWVLDNIPLDMLVVIAQLPAPLDELKKYVPEVEQYADWFGALIEEVRGALTEEGLIGEAATLAAGARNGTGHAPDVHAASAHGDGQHSAGQAGSP